MKISDAMSLAKCVRATASLTTLSLQCCMIDDDLLRMLMTGLIRNQTVTALDLSHNNITNYGVRLLSKLLGSKSVVRTCVCVAMMPFLAALGVVVLCALLLRGLAVDVACTCRRCSSVSTWWCASPAFFL
jgi:hypothetical protein